MIIELTTEQNNKVIMDLVGEATVAPIPNPKMNKAITRVINVLGVMTI